MRKAKTPRYEEIDLEAMCEALGIGSQEEVEIKTALEPSPPKKSSGIKKPKTLRGLRGLIRQYDSLGDDDSMILRRRKLLEVIDEVALTLLPRLKNFGDIHDLWTELPSISRATIPTFTRALGLLTKPEEFSWLYNDCGGSLYRAMIIRRAAHLFVKDN